MLATGAIVIGGVVYYAGSWLHDIVMPYIIGFRIPRRLREDGSTVDLGKFDEKVSGHDNVIWQNKKIGWSIEKDRAQHGGRKWKLRSRSGKRVASLDEDGNIIAK
ncbi:MAG: hypothetical protein ACLKAK_09055 [Alkaliphilus sp.]